MIRSRRRSPMQDAFDGLSERDAERLRAFLDVCAWKPSRAESRSRVPILTTDCGRKRGRRA